ncbi:MAG: alpha/beta hydrolase [Acidobacteriia bacterium]|nr:alpha/beta hydrolase [Terriglobia bacterium]
MPTIQTNGVELYYQESGAGPETIVFSHGLLMDHAMFHAQRAAFERRYRVIAYDHRGQGQSQDPGAGYDMETLTEDAAALITSLNAAPCHFAGLSMGGFVGMRLAARHRELVRSLTLMNTGAQKEETFSRLKFNFLAQLVKLMGTAPFAGIAVTELFGKSTRASTSPAKQAMLKEWTAKLRSRPKNTARALMGVMNRREVSSDELAGIRCPTLIIAGEDDKPQPPFRSERLAAAITGSKLVRIPACGHSSSLEAPDAVITAMRELMNRA